MYPKTHKKLIHVLTNKKLIHVQHKKLIHVPLKHTRNSYMYKNKQETHTCTPKTHKKLIHVQLKHTRNSYMYP